MELQSSVPGIFTRFQRVEIKLGCLGVEICTIMKLYTFSQNKGN